MHHQQLVPADGAPRHLNWSANASKPISVTSKKSTTPNSKEKPTSGYTWLHSKTQCEAMEVRYVQCTRPA